MFLLDLVDSVETPLIFLHVQSYLIAKNQIECTPLNRWDFWNLKKILKKRSGD